MKNTREIAKDYTDWHIKTGGFARDMTMRDHFAGLAMQAIVSTVPHLAVINPEHAAIESYEYADAMLKERAK